MQNFFTQEIAPMHMHVKIGKQAVTTAQSHCGQPDAGCFLRPMRLGRKCVKLFQGTPMPILFLYHLGAIIGL